MQQVARYAQNRELRIEVYHSYNELHATHDIVNYALRFIIRATSCTLRHRELRIEVNKRPQKTDDHITMTALFCITVKSAVRFSDVFYCVRYRRLQ